MSAVFGASETAEGRVAVALERIRGDRLGAIVRVRGEALAEARDIDAAARRRSAAAVGRCAVHGQGGARRRGSGDDRGQQSVRRTSRPSTRGRLAGNPLFVPCSRSWLTRSSPSRACLRMWPMPARTRRSRVPPRLCVRLASVRRRRHRSGWTRRATCSLPSGRPTITNCSSRPSRRARSHPPAEPRCRSRTSARAKRSLLDVPSVSIAGVQLVGPRGRTRTCLAPRLRSSRSTVETDGAP